MHLGLGVCKYIFYFAFFHLCWLLFYVHETIVVKTISAHTKATIIEDLVGLIKAFIIILAKGLWHPGLLSSSCYLKRAKFELIRETMTYEVG